MDSDYKISVFNLKQVGELWMFDINVKNTVSGYVEYIGKYNTDSTGEGLFELDTNRHIAGHSQFSLIKCSKQKAYARIRKYFEKALL